jgi:xanthine dehydrogenase molybdopterin-binding subunit B
MFVSLFVCLSVCLSLFPSLFACLQDSSLLQVSGEAAYADDTPQASNALFAAYVTSSRALATVLCVDWSPAMDVTGVWSRT